MTPLQTSYRSETVDVTSAAWQLSGSQRPIGIYCNGASTITASLVGDSATSAWVLVAGFNPLAFGLIASSSGTKSGMHILFKQ